MKAFIGTSLALGAQACISHNQRIIGDDVNGHYMSTLSAADCQRECQENILCWKFTYYEDGKECWRQGKSAFVDPLPYQGADSGPASCSQPPGGGSHTTLVGAAGEAEEGGESSKGGNEGSSLASSSPGNSSNSSSLPTYAWCLIALVGLVLLALAALAAMGGKKKKTKKAKTTEATATAVAAVPMVTPVQPVATVQRVVATPVVQAAPVVQPVALMTQTAQPQYVTAQPRVPVFAAAPVVSVTRNRPQFPASGPVADVRAQIGSPIICVIGGTAFKGEDSEELVGALAEELHSAVGRNAVFATGGMKGVQETFAKHCGDGSRVFNILPEGTDSGYGVGTDLHTGKTLEERMTVTGDLAEIYVSVEGGPGVAKEAVSATKHNAFIVPMIRTGGASSGMMGFPESAMQRPAFVNPTQWELLSRKDVPVRETARAAAAIISDYIRTRLP